MALFTALVLIGGYISYVRVSSNDDSSPTAIAAIEKQHGSGFISYLIHEHPVRDGEVAFFNREINDGQIVIGFEYIRKTSRGWKSGYGGAFGASNYRLGLTDGEARQEDFHAIHVPSTEGSEFGSSPFPMIYGVALHPDITRITVEDKKTGLERQAQMIEVERNFKLFYVFVDESQGEKFDITGYAADGSVVHEENEQGN